MKIFLDHLGYDRDIIYLELITSQKTFFLQRFLAKKFNFKITTGFKHLSNGLKEKNAAEQNISIHFASRIMLNHILWAIKPVCRSLQSMVTWPTNRKIHCVSLGSYEGKQSISNCCLQHTTRNKNVGKMTKLIIYNLTIPERLHRKHPN